MQSLQPSRLLFAVVLVVVAGAVAPNVHAQGTDLLLTDESALPGANVSVDLLGNIGSFSGFNLALGWDPAVVDLDQVSLGTELALDPPDFFSVNFGVIPGVVIVAAVQDMLGPGTVFSGAPPFSILIIDFLVPAGATPGTVTPVSFANSATSPVWNGVPVTTTDGSMTIGNSAPNFMRGDCNDDGAVDVADPIALLAALFGGGSFPPCLSSCDGNDDGGVNVADAVAILTALFVPGGALVTPPATCGQDPTPDSLNCLPNFCP